MTPDNPQERLRALIERMKIDVERLRHSSRIDLHAIAGDICDAIDLLDSAARSIPAGEDVEMAACVASLRHRCASSGFHDHDGCGCSDADLLGRELNASQTLSSELEQARARLEKAEEVIRPFARAMGVIRALPDEGVRLSDTDGARDYLARLHPTIGDFRAARRWIEGGE